MTTPRSGNRARGFSLLELMVVITIIVILSAMAISQMGPATSTMRADTAMRQVVEQLRSAREYAIANRRWVQITFPVVLNAGISENRVQITILNTKTLGAGADAALPPTPIQRPMTFYVFPAPVPDTPDAFGNASALVFGGVAGGPVGGMMFDPTGELVNEVTLQPINGSVFLGVTGHNETARAVSIMGTTGRVRGWSWNGTKWFQF
jgi:prepilin-type N-terminal cleavage/methylation domain-containing protein